MTDVRMASGDHFMGGGAGQTPRHRLAPAILNNVDRPRQDAAGETPDL
jgi:hypothetical protein